MLLADFVHRRGQVDDNQAEGRLLARSADNAVLEIHGPNLAFLILLNSSKKR
jgi:hypothetical protein